MRAIHVGISHDDDAVIAQLLDVKFVSTNRRTQGRNQRGDLLGRKHFLEARFFDIQHLAAQWQNRLKLAITPLLGRATGGIALNDVELTQSRIFFLTVCQFGRQAQPVHYALAARQFARFTRRFTGTRCLDDLAANDFCVVGFFHQKVGQRFGDHFFHRAAHLRRNQLVFGL